jgi:hypothetical protein
VYTTGKSGKMPDIENSSIGQKIKKKIKKRNPNFPDPPK